MTTTGTRAAICRRHLEHGGQRRSTSQRCCPRRVDYGAVGERV